MIGVASVQPGTEAGFSMFRFLHAADLHLDSPLRGLAAREDAPVGELLGASRRALDNLIGLATDEAVDFVVIAGDVYDRDWKDYSTGLFFRSQMVRLKEAGIPVFMIAGNHDAASTISRKLSLPDNVIQFSSKAPHTEQPGEWPVAIHGMSFPNRAVDENLVPRYPDPVADKFNLGILHTSLAGAEGHDTYAPCSVQDLESKGYQYWALGHIHQPTVISESPWIVYPGNIQGRHVRECGERGCRLVEVDDAMEVASCTWHALDVARWDAVEVDVNGLTEFGEIVASATTAMAVEEADGRLLALRITLVGATGLHGPLCSRPDRLEAEIEAAAREAGNGLIWIERVKVATRPLVDLDDLATRDPLTKVVVDAVHATDDGVVEWPAEVLTMLEALPADMRETLRAEWNGPGREDLMEDAGAMILERLTTKGGEA